MINRIKNILGMKVGLRNIIIKNLMNKKNNNISIYYLNGVVFKWVFWCFGGFLARKL